MKTSNFHHFTILCLLMAACAAFCAPLFAASSHAPVTIIAVNPPRGPRVPGWSQWVNDIEPHVDGVSIMCPWNQMETSQGVYDFSACDSNFKNFPTNLKFVIVLEPIAFKSNTYTPSYVYSYSWAKSLGTTQLDYATCQTHPGNGNTPLNTYGHAGDTSAFPAVWEKPIQVAWHNFLSAAVAHYNTVSFKNQILYIRAGYSEGGQASDPCQDVFVNMTGSITNLQVDWVGGNQAQSNFIASQDPQVQFEMAVACSQGAVWNCTNWADAEAATDIANRIGIGCEGAQYSDLQSQQDGHPASCDWVALFAKYSNAPVPRQLQSWSQTSVKGKLPTGSLSDLLPFEAESYASAVEIYIQDLACAYEPGYSDSTGCASGYAAYTPYQQAIAAAEQ
jgi:hypothetical protein